MKNTPRYNLDSPNSIATPCVMDDLYSWFSSEMDCIEVATIRTVALEVARHLEDFVSWPSKALLLWSGCDRTERYHRYPQIIRDVAKVAGVKSLDSRMNGPAIAAFQAAGGRRPRRYGSRNGWSIHHLYSGKFPYIGKQATLHATKSGFHFTQSAGLVAVHPIADQMCDEFPPFAWLLRAMAFVKFGYDPDYAFAQNGHDQFGFVGKTCILIPTDVNDGQEKSQDGCDEK